MKFNHVCSLFLLLVSISVSSEEKNDIHLNEYTIRISQDNNAYIEVYKGVKVINHCKIDGWDKSYSLGGGLMSLTNDRKGILIYSSNRYINVDEIFKCGSGSVTLHDIPDPNGGMDAVIDVNFENKIFMSLVVIDAQTNMYQVIVSHFNEKENIFSGGVFWDDSEKNIDDSFYVDLGDIYLGRISLDGKYVSPSDLDCSVDSFPGVWSINSKKKVIFSDSDESAVKHKCQQLFDGKATLEQLGGKLISGH
jgi:predicted nucleic-acid-binding Zn-ribbon protein